LQLGLRVHNDRSVPGHGLFERLPRDEQKPYSFLARLDGDLIAAVEQDERAIAGALADEGFGAIDLLLGERQRA
jgi:hypothetical protein